MSCGGNTKGGDHSTHNGLHQMYTAWHAQHLRLDFVSSACDAQHQSVVPIKPTSAPLQVCTS